MKGLVIAGMVAVGIVTAQESIPLPEDLPECTVGQAFLILLFLEYRIKYAISRSTPDGTITKLLRAVGYQKIPSKDRRDRHDDIPTDMQ